MKDETKSDEKKNQELKVPEIKRPINLRANAMPTSGFVLSVDGKLKTQYETVTEATTAGVKLKQNYPAIKVEVYDARARVYTQVDQLLQA
jgi:hypothetical protein